MRVTFQMCSYFTYKLHSDLSRPIRGPQHNAWNIMVASTHLVLPQKMLEKTKVM